MDQLISTPFTIAWADSAGTGRGTEVGVAEAIGVEEGVGVEVIDAVAVSVGSAARVAGTNSDHGLAPPPASKARTE